jgi:hypothetical protein
MAAAMARGDSGLVSSRAVRVGDGPRARGGASTKENHMARMSSLMVVVLGVSMLAGCVPPRRSRDTLTVAELSSRSEAKARAAAKRALRDEEKAVAAGERVPRSDGAAVAAVVRGSRSEEKAVAAAARVPRSEGAVAAAAESATATASAACTSGARARQGARGARPGATPGATRSKAVSAPVSGDGTAREAAPLRTSGSPP